MLILFVFLQKRKAVLGNKKTTFCFAISLIFTIFVTKSTTNNTYEKKATIINDACAGLDGRSESRRSDDW